jgi:hypothetical protein
MYDREFLLWLYERLIHIYDENPNIDYMCKLKCIINKMNPEQFTPNI